MGKLPNPQGDVKKFIACQKAELLYDLTYYFCHTFLSPKDRTIDQMIQAARSGKPNIAEGNLAKSRGTDVAANMAIAFLKQKDYLRHRRMKELEQDSLQNGGLREKMYAMRLEARNKIKKL